MNTVIKKKFLILTGKYLYESLYPVQFPLCQTQQEKMNFTEVHTKHKSRKIIFIFYTTGKHANTQKTTTEGTSIRKSYVCCSV